MSTEMKVKNSEPRQTMMHVDNVGINWKNNPEGRNGFFPKTDEKDYQLLESIRHDGLYTNLVVAPSNEEDLKLHGKEWTVYAGHRRLAAVKEILAEDKSFSKFVPVSIRSEKKTLTRGEIANITIATNLSSKDMDKDQCGEEFCAILAESGQTVNEFCSKTGYKLHFVRQCIAIYRVVVMDKSFRKAFREKLITGSQLEQVYQGFRKLKDDEAKFARATELVNKFIQENGGEPVKPGRKKGSAKPEGNRPAKTTPPTAGGGQDQPVTPPTSGEGQDQPVTPPASSGDQDQPVTLPTSGDPQDLVEDPDAPGYVGDIEVTDNFRSEIPTKSNKHTPKQYAIAGVRALVQAFPDITMEEAGDAFTEAIAEVMG